MKTEEKEIRKLHFLKTIAAKMVLISIIMILFSNWISLDSVFRKSKENLLITIENNMLDLTSAYAKVLESNANDQKEYEANLKNISINNTESSYAYLLDATGLMIYHPKSEKIGQAVENQFMKSVIESIDQYPVNQAVFGKYEYNNTNKYAAFEVLTNGTF